MAPALRFDRGARYGAGLVAMLFGGYLAVAVDFSAIVQSETYAGSIRTDVPAVNITQFILIVIVLVTGVAILPTDPMRRLGAVTLVCVSLFLWATFGLEQGVGNIVEPKALWAFLLNQGFIALLVSLGGWVIARGRHPLSWIVVVVAAVPAIVAPFLTAINFTTGGFALVMQGLVVVLGIGGAWAAAGIDRLIGRRGGADSTPDVERSADPDVASADPVGSGPTPSSRCRTRPTSGVRAPI